MSHEGGHGSPWSPYWLRPGICKTNFLNMLQTLEMLEKKENLLVKKANLEVEKAKNFTKAKNKRGTV
jgi:hypothetical protein